jgi:N4-gp56 family major capsid protein
VSDTFTQQSTVVSDTTAYEMLAYFALRPQLYFHAVADVKPSNQSHRGAATQFYIYTELAAQTTPLSETADPDSIAISDSTVTLTLAEYGAVIKTTAKLRATSFLDIDTDMANIIGFNAGLSVDTLDRTALQAGSNVRYSTGTGSAPAGRTTVTPVNSIRATDVRRARVDLVDAFVMPVNGPYYWAFIHPDVSFDLMQETGTAAWRDPHTYSAPENIWSGEVGLFERFRFVETPRAPLFSDGGSSPTTTDVYGTLFGGKQAMAMTHADSEGYSILPTIVRGPMVDALQRIQPIGWKYLYQPGRFREASLRRLESASTIGAN